MVQLFKAILLVALACATNANNTRPGYVRSPGVEASDTCTGGFNMAAQAYGKYFGTATAADELSDQPYTNLLDNKTLFGQITPAIGMKPGVFDFSAGDAIVNLAKANGQLLRCHALVWYQDLPNWVTSGQWNRQSLIDTLWTHITTVVVHYKGACYSWDVVNEALMDDGTLRENIFLDVIGPAYISIAFQAAAVADPNAKLYYNDYNIDNDYSAPPPSPSASGWGRRPRGRGTASAQPWNQPWEGQVQNKTDGAKLLVNMVRAQGARVDGIGLQGHYVYNATPSAQVLSGIMGYFTGMDLDIAMTELDIRMDLNNINAATEAMQAQGYGNVMTACKNTARCVGITLWDFTDRYSWVTSVFPDYGSSLPWDSNLVLKQQIYDAMMDAWGCGYD